VSGYVLDASVAVTALTEPGSTSAELLSGDDAVFQVPSIFDAEVLSALRGLVRGGKFDRSAATDLIADLIAFRSSAGTCRLCSRECGSCGRTSILTMPRWPR
jgi:predicted nucleic acid-binding protein